MVVLQTIVMNMPQENYETIFKTFVTWGRIGDVFNYDDAAEAFTPPRQLCRSSSCRVATRTP